MGRPSRHLKFRENQGRPDVYGYHALHLFLADWCGYLKSKDPRFSLKALAEKAQVTSSFLSMVLSGERQLSPETTRRLIAFLGLQADEEAYFENLSRLQPGRTKEAKIEALDRMSKSVRYQKHHPNE